METVKIQVWHNVDGEIVAVGRAMLDNDPITCVPLCAENQFVLETEMEESHIAELHRTQMVDVSRKALIQRR